MNPKDFTRYTHQELVNTKDIIPRGYGRPCRNNTIVKDEVVDLVILLNTTKSVDEFLKEIA